MTKRTFRNPILRGTNSDPSICRVGPDFYLVTATLGYWPGVPVYHSRDLVNWRMIGHCLHRNSQLSLGLKKLKEGTWAPDISHHEGVFRMTTTLMGQPGGARNLIVSAQDPAGPWSDPVWVNQGGIDPSLFFEDGRTYFLTTLRLPERDRNDIVISEIDLATGQRRSEITPLWSGIGELCPEGPHLYKVGRWYYLLIAEGGTYGGHMVNVARSESLLGPYESCPQNPVLTHRDDHSLPFQFCGHGDLVELPDGSWWMVHLGVRCSFYQKQHLGRETFLVPMEWTAEGWPRVKGGGRRTPVECEAPALNPCPWPAEPERDEFGTGRLGLHWTHIGNPVEANYDLQARPGWLRLQGAPAGLDSLDGPTFAGRRLEEFEVTATTLVEFDPLDAKATAGLVAYMDPSHRVELRILRGDEGLGVELRLFLERLDVRLGWLPMEAGSSVELRVESHKEFLRFHARPTGRTWSPLGECSTRYLCAEVTDNFTGLFLGLFASGRGAVADFGMFELRVQARDGER
jgi:xylan 1,4-beta-xylosidase